MTRTSFQRFELKYWVPEAVAGEAIRLASPFLRPDASGGGGAQVITSLYLETDDLLCYRRHADGAPDRFKLRVRTYGPDPTAAPTSFFELKRKVNSVVAKRRARVPTSWVRPLLEDAFTAAPPLAGKDAEHLQAFLYLQVTHRMRPMVLVRCRREALASVDPLEDVRVTIDRDVVGQAARGADLGCHEGAWMHLDSSREHGEPGRRVLLELKFHGAAPLWMHELTERLGMRRLAFSKYMAAMERLIGHDDAAADRVARA